MPSSCAPPTTFMRQSPAAAMKKGKHVFCQKPLTHTIYEARRIAEIAKQTGVATQIAVANQASEVNAPAM